MHDRLLAEYDAAVAALAAHGDAMRAQVAALLADDAALKVHSVMLRVKARGSLAAKLARPDRTYESLWDVTDLVGLRVITYFEDGVDRVGQLVEQRLLVDFERSIDKRRRGGAGFGYRSLHYVCRAAEMPLGYRYEIQVRSVLEHAWAEIEHDLGYKSRDAVPADAQRRLHRLAGLLELADQEFVAIRRDLHAYAADLPQRLATDGDAPLDRVSLAALLACPEACTLDAEIAAALAMPLGEEPFFPAYLVRMLASSGVRTVADARAGLARHRGAILAMVRPYFTFTAAAWRVSPAHLGRVYRGYSLFFLAHAAVLDSPALGITKVERLARLYRELDYPDDEGAAQRVASSLVDAFRDVVT